MLQPLLTDYVYRGIFAMLFISMYSEITSEKYGQSIENALLYAKGV